MNVFKVIHFLIITPCVKFIEVFLIHISCNTGLIPSPAVYRSIELSIIFNFNLFLHVLDYVLKNKIPQPRSDFSNNYNIKNDLHLERNRLIIIKNNHKNLYLMINNFITLKLRNRKNYSNFYTYKNKKNSAAVDLTS